MSRYDHKIETSLEGIEHLSKEKKENKERKMSPGLLDYKINGFQKNRIIIEWCTKGKGKVNRCTIHWEACYRKIKESPWKIECFLDGQWNYSLTNR